MELKTLYVQKLWLPKPSLSLGFLLGSGRVWPELTL